MNKRAIAVCLTAILSLTALVGCQQTIPKDALQLTGVTLETRQRQTRHFDTIDETRMLSASAAVLQDLGFNLDESETNLGIIVGSKNRDAVEAGQVAGAVVIAVLFNANVPIDKEQKIRASLVTRPHPIRLPYASPSNALSGTIGGRSAVSSGSMML